MGSGHRNIDQQKNIIIIISNFKSSSLKSSLTFITLLAVSIIIEVTHSNFNSNIYLPIDSNIITLNIKITINTSTQQDNTDFKDIHIHEPPSLVRVLSPKPLFNLIVLNNSIICTQVIGYLWLGVALYGVTF